MMIHILSNVHSCTKKQKQKNKECSFLLPHCSKCQSSDSDMCSAANLQCALSIQELGAGDRCRKKGFTLQGQKKERGRKRKRRKNDKIKVCLGNVTFVDILFQIR